MSEIQKTMKLEDKKIIFYGRPLYYKNMMDYKNELGCVSTEESYQIINNYFEFNKYKEESLNITNEEMFTLDPFVNLISNYVVKNKDYIISKVITHDNDKYYCDYYDAYLLNKMIFRTQPELGLLHRMKARNPLNNLEMNADVLYYRIDIDKMRAEYIGSDDDYLMYKSMRNYFRDNSINIEDKYLSTLDSKYVSDPTDNNAVFLCKEDIIKYEEGKYKRLLDKIKN